MESIRRYFPESWNFFTAYATITYEIILLVLYWWEYKRNQSVDIFQKVGKKLLHMPLSLMEIYQRNNSIGIFPAGKKKFVRIFRL